MHAFFVPSYRTKYRQKIIIRDPHRRGRDGTRDATGTATRHGGPVRTRRDGQSAGPGELAAARQRGDERRRVGFLSRFCLEPRETTSVRDFVWKQPRETTYFVVRYQLFYCVVKRYVMEYGK